MAGDPRPRGLGPVRAYRSGPLWLVCRGDVGRVVRPGGPAVSDARPAGPLAAHLHVSEPWSEPPEGEWPELVAATARAMAESPPEVDPRYLP